ncbi:DUF2971 domain-containing protein [Clostridium beijerinckii]|uniref:DUF2971 domain-containing protein n=1 Tax=Clostridium beijerinckii TaxID=1520 RepID=A0AAX0B6X3_CLOBE|nr:DUF2971 domain-containing protein [Clostridium beijerinckii]NRT90896.1 hypothetical protein [Clostridium beijerinckii]NYC70422.1 hypothetical protein [Clostridium beijerinckii]
MYRFRSTKYLLDEEFKELENQEIYFAPPEQLNDPMEGFKDIFWQGDEILWKNFLKHYLLCFEHIVSIWSVIGESERIEGNYIPVFKTETELLTEEHKQRFSDIKEKFFSNKCISNLPKLLSSRKVPIRINELTMYLEFVHKFAFDSINLVYSQKGLMDRIEILGDKADDVTTFQKIIEGANRFCEDINYKDNGEEIFEVLKNTSDELKLISYYNKDIDFNHHNMKFIIETFPSSYLSILDKLIYQKWYTACFMDNYHNSSVWGSYGDNHKGICLEFKTKKKEGDEYLTLKSIKSCGTTGDIVEKRDYELKKVTYQKKFIEIDFFKSLGRLSITKLKSQWYVDENGNSSKYIDLGKFDDDWRNLYWDDFYKSVTTKTEDWKYECEYRMVIDEYFTDYGEIEKRKLIYDFNDLDGIIFGIKTSDSDKIKIMRIIEKKCRETGRDKFNFYQAKYSHETGQIERKRLNLLKFK